ncbi:MULTISPECIES: hypothetical protein [unclassified Photorhabdus]|nr:MULTISPECIES: hypothetical protein [unclassified Photorhabdus]
MFIKNNTGLLFARHVTGISERESSWWKAFNRHLTKQRRVISKAFRPI